jgi:hypothetical protein
MEVSLHLLELLLHLYQELQMKRAGQWLLPDLMATHTNWTLMLHILHSSVLCRSLLYEQCGHILSWFVSE